MELTPYRVGQIVLGAGYGLGLILAGQAVFGLSCLALGYCSQVLADIDDQKHDQLTFLASLATWFGAGLIGSIGLLAVLFG